MNGLDFRVDCKDNPKKDLDRQNAWLMLPDQDLTGAGGPPGAGSLSGRRISTAGCLDAAKLGLTCVCMLLV
jgi:hypothetical protein